MPRGDIYVPATWLEWKSGPGAKSGVFVFERTGGHNATVVLDLEGSPERIAVDATGQFYVLSLDAAWVEGGLVYHVLTQSRVVRVFDTGGALVRQIALAPPDGTDLLAPSGLRADPASNQVARILRLRDGRWLIEWLHAAGTDPVRRSTARHEPAAADTVRAARSVVPGLEHDARRHALLDVACTPARPIISV